MGEGASANRQARAVRMGQHFRITQIRVAQSGDIAQLVAVMSRDLSSAYSHWKIVGVYHETRLHNNALLWAEKVPRPSRVTRTAGCAADEYHRRRRHDAAMKLMWAEFSELPYLETNKTLDGMRRRQARTPDGESALWRRSGCVSRRLKRRRGPQPTHGGCDATTIIPRWWRSSSTRAIRRRAWGADWWVPAGYALGRAFFFKSESE
jgi:hypothetical protein